MTSSLPPLAQAFSGAFGSATANVGSYPLDLITTRVQTTRSRKRRNGVMGIRQTATFVLNNRRRHIRLVRTIIHKDGYASLFEGIRTDTSATIISNFFYFYLYSFFRTQLIRWHETFKKPKSQLSVIEELSVGFLAGVVSRAVSTPLSIVTVRLQSSTSDDDDEQNTVEKGRVAEIHDAPTVTSIVKCIYHEDGLVGFWKGFKTTILLSTNPAITLFLFQAFRRLLLPASSRNNPSPTQGFIGGAVSNSIAICILYPIMLAKTRLQTQNPSDQHRTMIAVLKDAYDVDGWVGLYQGFEFQILKGFLNQGLTIMIKQRVEQIMLYLYIRYALTRK